jgi:hypothetical protein
METNLSWVYVYQHIVSQVYFHLQLWVNGLICMINKISVLNCYQLFIVTVIFYKVFFLFLPFLTRTTNRIWKNFEIPINDLKTFVYGNDKADRFFDNIKIKF